LDNSIYSSSSRLCARRALSDKLLQYYLELVEDLGLKKELDDKILELEYTYLYYHKLNRYYTMYNYDHTDLLQLEELHNNFVMLLHIYLEIAVIPAR
jgi:hypothetical protein